MYAERRYAPSTRKSSGGRDFRSNQSPYKKDNRRPKSDQFSKPVEAAQEGTYSANNNAEVKAEVADEGYSYDEAYVEADCIGYDEAPAEEIPEGGPAQVQDLEPTQTQSADLFVGGEKVIGNNIQQKPFEMKSKSQQNNSSTYHGEAGLFESGGKRMIDSSLLIKENEKKFSGRARLFVGNLQSNISETDIAQLFGKYGETNEVYINKDKGFGFVRLDYRINAEVARNALDGYQFKGRFIKVKFAAHQSAIEIHGIDRFCSNESLEAAFAQFGAVERATVICDERGKSKGYAIIEFGFKKSAQIALQKINEGLFVLGRLPKPVTAKPLTQVDDEGIHEKDLERVPGIMKDREYQARFIVPDTPDFDWAKRWKELDRLGNQQKESLEKQLEEDKEKLEIEIETSVHESEADYIRQELMQRQAALEEEIRRYDEMRNSSMRGRQGNSQMQGFRSKRSEEARKQDEFIKKQQQEIMRRHGAEEVMREMQNAAATVGMAGINPAAALAMAAGVPASAAAAANILQAHAAASQAMKGRDSMLRGNPGMQRMPGPRGPMNPGMMGPRGMMGPGGMRPMFDPGQGRGNIRAGMRRHGPRDGSYNHKRPRN